MVTWVPNKKLCELIGYTADAVRTKLRRRGCKNFSRSVFLFSHSLDPLPSPSLRENFNGVVCGNGEHAPACIEIWRYPVLYECGLDALQAQRRLICLTKTRPENRACHMYIDCLLLYTATGEVKGRSRLAGDAGDRGLRPR